jgi:TM2 domain-containing membrane protein YozV
MKSKSTAYILWFFLGFLGVHKFYLDKVGIGILYFFTFGLFGIGWLIDLFTLGSQVDAYNNALFIRQMGSNHNNNVNNIVVNVPGQPQQVAQASVTEQLHKLHELKEKGIISEEEYNTQKGKVLA